MNRRSMVMLAGLVLAVAVVWWFGDALWNALLALHGGGRHGGS